MSSALSAAADSTMPCRPLLRLSFLLLAAWVVVAGVRAQQPPAPPAPPAPAAEPAEPRAPGPETEERAGLRRLDTSSPAAPESDRREGWPPVGYQHVPAGRTMREVIAFFGGAVVEGRVTRDAVSIFGRTRVEDGGTVGGSVVAVLGRIDLRGSVGEDTVSVLGATAINGPVGGDVVTVLGNLHLGPRAVIARDVVVVGGRLERDPAAEIHGEVVHLPFLPQGADFGGLGVWFERCLLWGRPLAFDARLGWAWLVAGIALGFHLLVSLLFPRAVVHGAQTLETRPGGSLLALALTVILSPVAIALLALTIVGALVVPLFGLALFFGAIFGKTVMLAWLGRRLTPAGGAPVLAVLTGGVLVTLLYTVPVVGFLTFKVLSWVGLGAVVYAVALATRREGPLAVPAAGVAPVGIVPPAGGVPPSPPFVHRAPAVPPAAAAPGFVPPVVSHDTAAGTPPADDVPAPAGIPVAVPPASVAAPAPSLPAAAETTVPPAGGVPPSGSPPPAPPPVASGPLPVPPALALPRAGFFIRMAALALDAILVGMILNLTSGLLPRFLQIQHGPGGLLVVLAVYAACLWKLRGTTIGGIVCGLKVVRLDQRELDWATAVVRALGCFLSLVVGGLGFVWVAFDDEKQSWHDKIAGTTVVRVPKGTPLV